MGRLRRRMPRGDLLPSFRLAAGDRGSLPPSHAFPLRGAGGAHRGRAAAGARQEPAVRRRAGVASRSPSTEAWPPTTARRQRPSKHEAQALARSDSASITSSCATSRRGIPDWPTQDLYVTFRKEILAGCRGQHAGDSAQAAGDGAQGHQERIAQRDRRGARTASSRSMPTTCTGTARRRCRSDISRRCSACSARIARC